MKLTETAQKRGGSGREKIGGWEVGRSFVDLSVDLSVSGMRHIPSSSTN